MSDTATATPKTDLPAAGAWEIDPAHSSVEAVARHLMVTKVRGRFADFSGTIHIADPVEDSHVDVTIEAASIDTREADRDEHLRSPDFLNVDEHPALTFTSTGIDHVGGNRYRMTGDLTIRGKSNDVTLDVEYLGQTTDPWGNPRALLSATTQLNREDWGMTWNQALETGGVLVSKKLDVEIEISATPADE